MFHDATQYPQKTKSNILTHAQTDIYIYIYIYIREQIEGVPILWGDRSGFSENVGGQLTPIFHVLLHFYVTIFPKCSKSIFFGTIFKKKGQKTSNFRFAKLRLLWRLETLKNHVLFHLCDNFFKHFLKPTFFKFQERNCQNFVNNPEIFAGGFLRFSCECQRCL